MKKFTMMMLALAMMSGCGELLEEQCIANTSPKRFVHRVRQGNCKNMDKLEGTQSIWYGASNQQCGMFNIDNTEAIEDTECTLRTEYTGFVDETGPYGVYGTLTINCPSQSCYVDVGVSVKDL